MIEDPILCLNIINLKDKNKKYYSIQLFNAEMERGDKVCYLVKNFQ